MKKYVFLLIFLAPVFSFGQLQNKDKIAIESYAEGMCTCVDKLINTLGTKTIEFIRIMTYDGMEALEKSLAEYYETVTEEEFNKQISFFDVMSTEAFQDKIAACDNKNGLSEEVSKSIDEYTGESSDYFVGYLKYHVKCEMMDILLQLGREGVDEKN